MSQYQVAKPEYADASYGNHCRNKRQYSSRKLALGIIRVMVKNGADGSRLNPYKCRSCRYWHIGNAWRH